MRRCTLVAGLGSDRYRQSWCQGTGRRSPGVAAGNERWGKVKDTSPWAVLTARNRYISRLIDIISNLVILARWHILETTPHLSLSLLRGTLSLENRLCASLKHFSRILYPSYRAILHNDHDREPRHRHYHTRSLLIYTILSIYLSRNIAFLLAYVFALTCHKSLAMIVSLFPLGFFKNLRS